MSTDRVAVPTAILVAVFATGAALGSVMILSDIPPQAPPPPVSAPYSEPINYSMEVVQIPSNGAGWGPVTNTSFEGVRFLFCPEFLSSEWFYLQGTGTELNGIRLAFLVWQDNSSGIGTGSPLFPSEAIRSWFSPDGVFGVAWLSSTARSITVEISVASPLPRFSSENVTLNPIVNFTEVPKTTVYLGVTFSLQVLGWGTPAGPTLNATAAMPNGTTHSLSMWAGPLLACAAANNTPGWVADHATCLERGSPDHVVAVQWDSYLSVTLMVRVG